MLAKINLLLSSSILVLAMVLGLASRQNAVANVDDQCPTSTIYQQYSCNSTPRIEFARTECMMHMAEEVICCQYSAYNVWCDDTTPSTYKDYIMDRTAVQLNALCKVRDETPVDTDGDGTPDNPGGSACEQF